MKHEFPDIWYRFLHPTDLDAVAQSIDLELSAERFPFLFRGRKIVSSNLEFYLKFRDEPDPLGQNKTYAEEYQQSGKPLKAKLTLAPCLPADLHGSTELNEDLEFKISSPSGIPKAEVVLKERKLNMPAKITIEVSEAQVQEVAKELGESDSRGSTAHTRLRSGAIEDLIIIYHYTAG